MNFAYTCLHILIYSASQQKKIFQNIFRNCSYMWVAIGLFYQMIPKKSDDIVCLSEQEPHLWNWPKSRLDRNWYLFCLLSAKLIVVKRLRNYHSDGLMTIYERIYALLCVYSDVCYQHFMLHWTINYIIEHFGYFLVFHSINYHSINDRTHQKVTKCSIK